MTYAPEGFRRKWIVYDYTYHPIPIAMFDSEEEAKEYADSHGHVRTYIVPFEDHSHIPGEES